MSIQRALDRFLAESRQAQEKNRNQVPIIPANLNMSKARSSNNVPEPDAVRGLTDRVEQLEREVSCLVRRFRDMERHLAAVTAERDMLQEEVERLRRNLPWLCCPSCLFYTFFFCIEPWSPTACNRYLYEWNNFLFNRIKCFTLNDLPSRINININWWNCRLNSDNKGLPIRNWVFILIQIGVPGPFKILWLFDHFNSS